MSDGSRTREGRRLRVVWNPTAGSKAGLPTNLIDEAALRDALEKRDLLVELAAPSSEDEAREAVRRAVADGVDVVAAAGGDGTVGLVADELIGTDVALGILPLGSAMNVARSLGVPRDLAAAVDVLVDGERRAIDVGYAAGRPFHEAVSIGLSAALFGEAQRIDRGEYRALAGLVHVLATHRPAAVRITLDGRPLATRALMVTIANGPYTGLGLTLAPDARIDDGFLDVRIVGRFSTGELIRHFWSIAFGRRRYHPRIRTERARTVRVESRRPMPVRADDADLGTTPVEVTVAARCLWVIAPPATAAPQA